MGDCADRAGDGRGADFGRRTDRKALLMSKGSWSTVPTLGNFKLPTIDLMCTECDRRGRYSLERARERHGHEMTLNQFMRLMARCPRDGDERRPCRVGCPDLAYMFTGAPFTDKFPGD